MIPLTTLLQVATPITRMLTFVLDTSFMPTHYENDWRAMAGGGRLGVCVHIWAYLIYLLWNLQQNEQQAKDWKMQQCLVLSWQRVISEEQMCWQLLGQHFGTSEVSRAPWWSVSTVWLSNAKASRDTGNHTQFSKAKGLSAEVNSTWISCVNTVWS